MLALAAMPVVFMPRETITLGMEESITAGESLS